MHLHADRFYRQLELLEKLAFQVARYLEHIVLLAGEQDALHVEHYEKTLKSEISDKLDVAQLIIGISVPVEKCAQFAMERL